MPSLSSTMNHAENNITVDPLAPATPVGDPEIAEIIDAGTGKILDAKEFIASHRYGDLVAARVGMREDLKSDRPRHLCALCATPVYLVANLYKRFFFRHRSEDGSCPAVTRADLTEYEIRARKYHGLRESEAHKRIKALIERSLRADPMFVAETIQSERYWRSEIEPKKWRRPDVQAVRANRRFAFEAQLSTTFLDVVVERRMFYREEGALLVWVLAEFSPEYRRLTHDDLLFSNNSNIFVVDKETACISEEKKRFHLRCHFRRPYPNEGMISNRWDQAVVAFDELTQEIDRQRIFLFDYEGAERRTWERLDQEVRDAAISIWAENDEHRFASGQDRLQEWIEIKEKLQDRDVDVPDHPTSDSSFRTMMLAVLSGLRGRPVGWHFDTLIQCAHQTAQGHPENLLAFSYAIKVGGHEELLRKQDISGKWERRCQLNRERIRAGDQSFLPPPEWLPALRFLFPEVGKLVTEFLERNFSTA